MEIFIAGTKGFIMRSFNFSHAVLALSTILIGASASALDILDVPVAAVSNRVYLADMPERPWWNRAWKRRAAILVSNMSDVREERAMIDFIFDVSEAVEAKSVRVVTPWGTAVPCVAEPVRQGEGALITARSRDVPALVAPTALRLLFETSLRERENRPFFIYWGNPDAPTQGIDSPMTLSCREDEVRVNNGIIEVVFDNLRRTDGLMKKLKVNASQAPSELLWRTTGFAWRGFEFSAGRAPKPWSKAVITADNAFRKTVTFTNEDAVLDFTFYAGQPRVDYVYRLKDGLHNARIDVSWACGGDCGHDDFTYRGLSGQLLTFRAALDHVTDCMPQPEYYRFPWLSEGWYAITDRRNRDVVGMVFDRRALGGVSYIGQGQSSGEYVSLNFNHAPKGKTPVTGSGALVATVGEARTVATLYAWLTHPPKVFVAKAESYREIPVKVPVLDRDFCVNVNVGGWRSSTPLPGDEWAPNIIAHIRALGANTILLGQLTDYSWTSLPISKDLFDRLCAHKKARNPSWKAPEWKGGYDGRLLKRICAEAHSNGLAVCTWHDALPGFSYGGKFDAEEQALCREMQALYPMCGVDSTFNALGGGEGVEFPDDDLKKFGRAYWKWPDPEPFFASRRLSGEYMKAFYEYSHKVNPGTKVMVFNSENSELERDMCMGYYPGVMDTLFCEFVAGMNLSKIKHTAKRLRGYFDNRDGHTIHAHYYNMTKDYAHRIGQLEMPFICGINGFSQESMTYENFDRDLFEITADFNRFALYTKLGPKVAKMAPVKNLAVLRDMACFEEDCRKYRTMPRDWWHASRHDARVNAFAEILSYNYDVVINPHFKAGSLARYKAVYLTDDEVLPEALAAELVAYVKAGGGAVIEGSAVERLNVEEVKGWEDGKVIELGKGRIVWTKEVLTDPMMKGDAKAIARVKALVASVGGVAPFEIASKSLDGILQAGEEGMFLGVYNKGKTEDRGKVTLYVGSPSYVLDVKKGVRFPFTNGFEIAVGPRQCGFYLIGGDAFTAIPAAQEAAWMGAALASVRPAGQKPPENPDPAFRPYVAVEFTSVRGEGAKAKAAGITRSRLAGIERRRFVTDEATLCRTLKVDDLDVWRSNNTDVKTYSAQAFAAALKTAHYVHFSANPKDCDAAFADCAEELKALLRRGGGLLFDRNGTGPAARRFLAEIGVFDPYPTAKRGIGDGAPAWDETFPTNHPYYATNETKPRYGVQRLEADGGQYSLAFTKWDPQTQLAPFRTARDPSAAELVIQDKVLGAGKVVFNQNSRSFNDWYETKTYGNVILSWFIGMPVDEHAKKARFFVGGIGESVK